MVAFCSAWLPSATTPRLPGRMLAPSAMATETPFAGSEDSRASLAAGVAVAGLQNIQKNDF